MVMCLKQLAMTLPAMTSWEWEVYTTWGIKKFTWHWFFPRMIIRGGLGPQGGPQGPGENFLGKQKYFGDFPRLQ
jgi:hypothetical protein